MRTVYRQFKAKSFDDFDSESYRVKLLVRDIKVHKKIKVLNVPKNVYDYYLNLKAYEESIGIFDHPQVEAFFEDIVKKYEVKTYFKPDKPEPPENVLVKEGQL